ncbi:MAG: hypothetical protein ACXWRA_00600 [Pseudobdellovibrionaceae bacterium]
MKKQFITFIFAVSAVFSICARASTDLLPGSTVRLSGTSAEAEIDLAGGVVIDKITPFKILSKTGELLFRGNLQNRIVRSSSDGSLHFYYRIRDTQAGLPGMISAIATQSFRLTSRVSTSYRVDGTGLVVPQYASRSYSGEQVTFRFGLRGPWRFHAGENSKFFMIKTDAKHYNGFGYTRITLRTGQSVLIKTAQPQVL